MYMSSDNSIMISYGRTGAIDCASFGQSKFVLISTFSYKFRFFTRSFPVQMTMPNFILKYLTHLYKFW